MANAAFKTGRYSKYMPARLLEKYHESVADPELLNMRQDIALIDARLNDLLVMVDKGDAAKRWDDARQANDDIQKALHSENWGQLMILCLQLDRAIGDAVTDNEAWTQIQSLLEQRRKLVESEQKRLVSMQQMITSEQAMTLIAAVTALVMENVPDQSARQKISNGLSRLVSMGESAA